MRVALEAGQRQLLLPTLSAPRVNCFGLAGLAAKLLEVLRARAERQPEPEARFTVAVRAGAWLGT